MTICLANVIFLNYYCFKDHQLCQTRVCILRISSNSVGLSLNPKKPTKKLKKLPFWCFFLNRFVFNVIWIWNVLEQGNSHWGARHLFPRVEIFIFIISSNTYYICYRKLVGFYLMHVFRWICAIISLTLHLIKKDIRHKSEAH